MSSVELLDEVERLLAEFLQAAAVLVQRFGEVSVPADAIEARGQARASLLASLYFTSLFDQNAARRDASA